MFWFDRGSILDCSAQRKERKSSKDREEETGGRGKGVGGGELRDRGQRKGDSHAQEGSYHIYIKSISVIYLFIYHFLWQIRVASPGSGYRRATT